MAKKKEIKPQINLHKEASRLPGYILCVIWLIFTVLLIGWVVLASFSTSREILSGQLFKFASGLHFENYTNAWKSQKISVFFLNSVIYTTISCTLIIMVAAPAAYALSRFQFRGNMVLQNLFATALGIPVIMIIMPLFSVITSLSLTNTRGLIIFLYVAMNVPFTIFFLLAFFSNLSTTFEEAAAIDGCSPIQTFWKIMFPLAQPGIVTVTIFNFIAIWNEFFMSMLFASKQRVRPIAVGLYNMVKGMQYTNDYGGMFAAVIIVFAPTFILYLFLSDKIIAGVTGGAIKG
ncbi:carbohydrate ABC transporter permease [Hungatella hathewayi]|uniref:carbohydrate ABC transporter permease n=1 Tax=Hungatella hathewayi TaxID=154046 RepID=UPI0035655E72